MARDFIITKEHRRFKEFATAVRKEKTIGICHGEAGVGKTLSARRYAHWDEVGTFVDEWGPRSAADTKVQATAHRSRTVFYTPEVLPRHKQIMNDIGHLQTRVGFCIDEHLRTIGKVTGVHVGNVAKLVELVIIDEAERLTPTALELLRDEHDRHELAIIFIGMSGITHSCTHASGSPTTTVHLAATNFSSSSNDNGNVWDQHSTWTISPTPRPSSLSKESREATFVCSNASSPRSVES